MSSARAFKLSDKFIDDYKDKEVPWGPVGYVTFKRTYPRKLSETIPGAEGTEEWYQTCRRVIEGTFDMQKQHCVAAGLPWNDAKAQRTAKEAYERLFHGKWTPPGRGLWIQNTDFVKNRTGAALFNCAFYSTKDLAISGAKLFAWAMDALMLGVGVGFDTLGTGTLTIQEPSYSETIHIVSDDREGWVEIVRIVLDGYLLGGIIPKNIDFSKIRGAGEPIKGFGGTSSGPQPLVELIETIHELYSPLIGQPITSELIVDTNNIIGRCVVAGNVRRSAELSMGSPDDETFIHLKQDQDKLAKWRWCSNNSIVAKVGMDYTQLANLTKTNGEPGYIWLDNARNYGRMKDGPRKDDLKVMGFNPCFAGDTKLLTTKGWQTFESLYASQEAPVILQDGRVTYNGPENDNNNPEFWRVEKNHSAQGVNQAKPVRLTRKSAPILKIETKQGLELRVTPDHHIATQRGMVEAQDLTKKDKILVGNVNRTSFSKLDKTSFAHQIGILVGELLGDGIIYTGYHSPQVRFSFWGNERSRINKITSIIEELWEMAPPSLKNWSDSNSNRQIKPFLLTEVEERSETRVSSTFLFRLFEFLGVYKTTNKKEFYPPNLDNENFMMGIVEGLFATDGTVGFTTKEKGLSLRIAQADKSLLQKIQLHLLQYNIFGKIYKRREAQMTELPDGKGGSRLYPTKEMYEIVFNGKGRDNLVRFIDLDSEKAQKYDEARKNFKANSPSECFWATLDNLTFDGYEDVYCLSEPVRRTVVANGIVARRCVEQQLEHMEMCCLCETFIANHDTLDDWIKSLKFAYLYAKTVTLAKTHWPETNQIMLKNRRIGLSITGIVQAINKFGYRNVFTAIDKAYDYVQDLDSVYSDWLCIPKSKRTTSIKPSGTVSKLFGATPGMHYPENEFYIQRIRFADTSDLLPSLAEAGYHIEDCVYSPNTKVVSFPVREPYFKKGKADITMWEQLELAAQLQHYWADNSVSVTITFKPEEADDIAKALEMYETKLKAVSFLQYKETGYKQAPMEPITEEQYNEMISTIKTLSLSQAKEEGVGTIFCTNDSCEIKYA